MQKIDISKAPQPVDFLSVPICYGQKFVVTVDTEEEFDWDKPLRRTGHSLDTVPSLTKFQQFCEGQGIKPVYLVDYPIITNRSAAEILADFVHRDAAEVGIQLHPWVNPPHDETVNEGNSFAGNLPRELERAKLHVLCDLIAKAIGRDPVIYRAGRYGVGPHTHELLREAGVKIDTSVRANFDYSAGHGPDFRQHPLRPYWIDRDARLIEIPLTSVFWGLMRKQGHILHPLAARFPFARAVLSRTAMLERIALTPEGINIDEAIKGIDMALDDGLPLLNFSFHSPSLRPGYTPYVREKRDVDSLYDWWRSIFAYLELRNIEPTSMSEFYAATVD